ncbi:hypothetical protein [Pseudomonas baetica]|uniref:hypothetical protein n=1 Tax=Pseudomonas baetica TaxID=674054 RepID=UPI0024069B70|nr:hypothetical protein [Pseudomonas baetica]MDF9778758.1 hypothetical protein [Pseudomonas baetica]
MAEDLTAQYEAALSALWRKVHATIERDIYKNLTESRLGEISTRALYQVECWPADLKSFLWRKHGDGCMPQSTVHSLEAEIDQVAAMVTLRPLHIVQAALQSS